MLTGRIDIALSTKATPERNFATLSETVPAQPRTSRGEGIANRVGRLWWASMALERLGPVTDSQCEQSAGGSLAVAVARVALENGGPRIALQMLKYPPLDLVTPTGDKSSTQDKPVMRPWMYSVFDRLTFPIRTPGVTGSSPPAWDGNADGLAGIAPALVVTCEFDWLRDEDARYAAALDAVGALAEHHDVPGTDHGYNNPRLRPPRTDRKHPRPERRTTTQRPRLKIPQHGNSQR